jgi:hypothetical protein
MADPTFETRLRSRLRNVLDSQSGPHPVWTDAPAARRTSDRQHRGRWSIRVLAVAAVLAIGGGALSLVGSWQPRPDDTPPSPEPTAPAIVEAPVVPDILRGQFVAQFPASGTAIEYPFYFIDLENAVLVHGPGTSDDFVEIRAEDGTAADWAGRIVRFTPLSAGSATVVIQAPPPCGEGRYLVRYDEAERPADLAWTLTFTQPQDRCAARLAILVGGSDGLTTPPSASPEDGAPSSSATTARVWKHQPTRLVSGERYSSWSFTEPFHFLMPPAALQASALTWLAPGRLEFHHPWWFAKFFDDWTLSIDYCDPGAGSLPDIPPSPQAFESWLRSDSRSIDEIVEIEVDGRTAMRYATTASSCPGQEPNTFASRWYLIPTGDDTILLDFYGDTETEYRVADDIVRSMTFD